MTLPTSRGFARATCVLASLALVSTAPTFAQDCWLPDAFEPNDLSPVTITPGLYDDLRLSGADLYHDQDIDQFRIVVPAFQRLSLDFDTPIPPNSTAVTSTRIIGTIEPEDASEPARFYDSAPTGITHPAVYDNATNTAISVVFTVERGWNYPLGCTEYAMNVSIAPRPCDVLTDDALEGPDDCANATVLPVGVHSGLIVFSDRRSAGRDADVYRIPNIAPGDWFEVEISGDANDGSTPEMELFVGDDCNGLQVGDWHYEYVTNASLSVSDYTLRITSDHIAGFEEYTLILRSGHCSSTTPDAFEPNSACGPFAPLSEGTHSLTLTSGDSDGFLITIPPDYRLRAWVMVESDRQKLDVGGATAPTCPPVGLYDLHQKYNQGANPLDYHLRVDSRDGSCAEYTLELVLEPILCTGAHIAENEPNDDCASATPIALINDHASVTLALSPGDVDHFLVRVPASRDLEFDVSGDLPSLVGFRVTATAMSDCSGRSWSVQYPGTEFVIPPPQARLSNRSNSPQDYVLRVEPTDPQTECRVIHLGMRSVLPIERETGSSCETAGPTGDWSVVRGNVGVEESIFAMASVEPGQTLTAVFFEGFHLINTPLELRFHDGTADCQARNASLGSVRYEPPAVVDYDTPSWATLRHQYTNTSSTARRVIVELAEDPAHCQWLANMAISLQLSPGPPGDTFCVGNGVTFGTLTCPCDNPSLAGHAEGCRNSTGRGARLSATGTTSIAAGDLLLHADGLPAGTPIVAVGVRTTTAMTNASARTFMDGLLCLGIDAEAMQFGTADATGAWTASTALQGQLGTLTPGERVFLQAWYRDASGPCGAGSNLTNGVRVEWRD